MTAASVDYPECGGQPRRVAATDLVSCYAERVSIPNQKFLYDTPRAKRFVGRYEYDRTISRANSSTVVGACAGEADRAKQ